jgi:hypothetical protein
MGSVIAMKKLIIIMIVAIFIFNLPSDFIPTSAAVSIVENTVTFSCSDSEATIQAKNGPRVTSGNITIYNGYRQLGINKDPITARFTGGVQTWCRTDYETTPDDQTGYGLLWENNLLFGFFTATGTQSGNDFRRFAASGWMPSYGQGGGAKVSIVAQIDPANGDVLRATFVTSRNSNGNSNSLIFTNAAVTANSLILYAKSWFSPRNMNKTSMTCTGGSPFDYTLILSLDLSTAQRATADRCVPNVLTAKDTVGVYHPESGLWELRNSNANGAPDISFAFGGAPSHYPIVGDWNGDSVDTAGVYDRSSGTFLLRDSNSTGPATYSFVLGNPDDMPLAGRWAFGATHDGAGVFRPANGIIYLKNELTTGFADYYMVLGNPSDKGVAGDWNGDGKDTPGVFRPSNTTFYLSNQTPNGVTFSDVSFSFGGASDVPIAGNWSGYGRVGVGTYRSTAGQFYLKHWMNTGAPDMTVTYGGATTIPVVGHWIAGSFPPPNVVVNVGSKPMIDQAGSGD